MREKHKRVLKRVGKGVLYTAATGGAYFLARGVLNLILKRLTPEKELSLKKSKSASPSSSI
jgi:hypothetical protein